MNNVWAEDPMENNQYGLSTNSNSKYGLSSNSNSKSKFGPSTISPYSSSHNRHKPIMKSQNKPSSADPKLSGAKILKPTTHLNGSPSVSRNLISKSQPSSEEKQIFPNGDKIKSIVENIELSNDSFNSNKQLQKRSLEESMPDDIEEYPEDPKRKTRKEYPLTLRQRQVTTKDSLSTLNFSSNTEIINFINRNPSITREDKKYNSYRNPERNTRSSSENRVITYDDYDYNNGSKSRELSSLQMNPTVYNYHSTRSMSKIKKSSEPQTIDLLSDSDDDAKVKTTTDFYNPLGNNLNPISLSPSSDPFQPVSQEKVPPTEHVPLTPLKQLFFGQIEFNESNCISCSFSIETIPFVGFRCLYALFNDNDNSDANDNAYFEERIPYINISSFHLIQLSNSQGMIALKLKNKTELKNFVVGPNKTIDPECKIPRLKLKKYIILVMKDSDYKIMETAIVKWNKSSTTEEATTFINLFKDNQNNNFKKSYQHALYEVECREKQSKRAERRRTSMLNTAALNIFDPKDAATYVVYPSEPDSVDAVTIFYGDLKRLEPCVYFNDSLIDLKIKTIIADLPEDKRNKVHAFSCLFYAKLTEIKNDSEKAYALVERWTKNVNLFELDFILFPINLNNHWSLIVVTRPSKILNIDNQDESKQDISEDTISIQDAEDLPCLLHLDSLSMHPTKTISQTILRYLYHERETKVFKKNSSDEIIKPAESSSKDELDQEKLTNQFTGSEFLTQKDFESEVKSQNSAQLVDTDPEIETPSAKRQKRKSQTPETTKRLKEFENKIPTIKCKVPRQHNGYDCGVFVIRFGEMILKLWPTSNLRDIETRFADQFAEEFSQSDIDVERDNIKKLLANLREKWLEIRKNTKEELVKDKVNNGESNENDKENERNDQNEPTSPDSNNLVLEEEHINYTFENQIFSHPDKNINNDDTNICQNQDSSSLDSESIPDEIPSVPPINNTSEDSADESSNNSMDIDSEIKEMESKALTEVSNKNRENTSFLGIKQSPHKVNQNSNLNSPREPFTRFANIFFSDHKMDISSSSPNNTLGKSKKIPSTSLNELTQVLTPETVQNKDSKSKDKGKEKVVQKPSFSEFKQSKSQHTPLEIPSNQEIDLSLSPSKNFLHIQDNNEDELEFHSSRNKATTSHSKNRFTNFMNTEDC